MANNSRLTTGVPGLDELLGGGLIPGTLTVVSGATGIGKTQLGVQFAAAGQRQEGERGIIFDMSARGDAQSHADYALRMFDWRLEATDPNRPFVAEQFFDRLAESGDYLRVFDYQGRRVTRGDLSFEGWQDWQSEVSRKLTAAIAFFYGNFLRGARRAVIDGVEPVGRARQTRSSWSCSNTSITRSCAKIPNGLLAIYSARNFAKCRSTSAARRTTTLRSAACSLYTSHEVMLEELASRPLEEGDQLANANTVIYFGKVRNGNRLSRALYIAKHRGSACADEIVPYTIDDAGHPRRLNAALPIRTTAHHLC